VDDLFQTIFMESPEAIALTRARDAAIIEVNDEWVRLTGFSRESVIGRTAVEIGHWTDEAARQKALQPLSSLGRVRDLDITMLFANGVHRMICMNAVLVTVQGESYILFYLRDVTVERMSQAAVLAGERALAQTNEKLNRQVTLHEMTESVAKVGHWVVYPGDAMVSLSRGYCAVGKLGDVQTAPMGEHFKAVEDEYKPLLKQAIRQMNGDIVEYRWRRTDGEVLWMRSRMHRQIENGEIKAEFGVVQDISSERAALQAAADQLAAAQQSEARFRGLTQLSSDWYWEQDTDYRFVRVDGDMGADRGISSDSFIGLTHWDSGVEGVTDAQWAVHRAALEARETFHDLEMCRRSADGKLIWVAVSGAPIFDSHGVFVGYRGTGREITARKQAESDIERLAFYDALTGLPNRRLLIDRLTQAVASSARRNCFGALLFIDLDNFKVLNDTRGHHMGDELLKQVALRLTECVRSIDTVARLGGDEFVVMLEDLGSVEIDAAAQAEAIGKKILATINTHFVLGDQTHHSSPSIGVTLFFNHQQSVDELLQRADLAMYQSKALFLPRDASGGQCAGSAGD
jgi:diguanylate cyclase (GGDEF)-like protein/PAS domain S-box-containing protein